MQTVRFRCELYRRNMWCQWGWQDKCRKSSQWFHFLFLVKLQKFKQRRFVVYLTIFSFHYWPPISICVYTLIIMSLPWSCHVFPGNVFCLMCFQEIHKHLRGMVHVMCNWTDAKRQDVTPPWMNSCVCVCLCRRRGTARGPVSATWRRARAATASTCTVRSPDRASSSEPWMTALRHRGPASDHRTRSSRYTRSLFKHRPWTVAGFHCVVCICVNCNPITSACKSQKQMESGRIC